jgi:hypothetical protein
MLIKTEEGRLKGGILHFILTFWSCIMFDVAINGDVNAEKWKDDRKRLSFFFY